MNYTFTDGTRAALAAAREEALALAHDYVGTEHILLGVAREREGPAARLLRSWGATEEGIRAELGRIVRRGRGFRTAPRELPYTSRAKKVLELAMADARRLKLTEVGTAQLLAGLVREEKGLAAQILARLGIGPAELEADASGATAEAEGDARPVWFLEVDAVAAAPIYEQIIARVEEAVATGRLEVGERLPTVRQLAEELGIAPGTVARAYSELERRGVIETAGARGTHVARRGSTSEAREEELEGLLRPVAIAAFHMGATADQLRSALDRAMRGLSLRDASAN